MILSQDDTESIFPQVFLYFVVEMQLLVFLFVFKKKKNFKY